VEALNTSGDADVYHALEVQIDDMYHGRQGAVAVGMSAARQVERVYDRDGLSHAMDCVVIKVQTLT